MPPVRRQSTARLPSLAPHGVGRGCNTNRHAEDSWRSHVHRTRFRRLRSSSRSRLPMCGVKGQDPLPFSGGSKGGILFGKRIPPLFGSSAKSCTDHAAQRAATSRPLKGESKGIPSSEREYPLCLAAALSAALSMQRQRRCTLPPPCKGGIKRETLFGKRIPPLSGSGAKRRMIYAAQRAAPSRPLVREESKGKPSSKREFPL